MDRKMVAAGEKEIPPPSEMVESSKSSLEKLQERQELVRGEVLKFYISCRREIPEASMMDAEVSVAMEDWQDIPSGRLSEICGEARRRGQGFLPANSLVIDLWAEIWHKEIKAARDRDFQDSLRAVTPQRTEQEKKFIEDFFASARESLGRGNRLEGWTL